MSTSLSRSLIYPLSQCPLPSHSASTSSRRQKYTPVLIAQRIRTGNHCSQRLQRASRFSELTQVLCRQTEVRVRGRPRVNDKFDLQGIQDPGDVQMATQVPAVQATDRRSMSQSGFRTTTRIAGFGDVPFTSTSILMLPFSPTSKTESLDWQYTFQFIVPFPGIGKIQMPIHLSLVLRWDVLPRSELTAHRA